MAVPKVIEQQVAAAEKLQQDVYAPQATPEAQPPEPVQSEQPAETPKPTAEVVELHSKPAEPTASQPPKPAQDDAALWKQRFDSLQGKYNKEVPILHRQLKEQTQQMSAVQAQLEELRNKATSAPEQAATSVKDSDVESFGADLIEFVQRMARSIASEVMKNAVAEIYKNLGTVREQVTAVEETTVQSRMDRFWEKVSELVPDWDTVDQDPSWVEFLNSAPEFSERTYRELAQDAITSGSAAKIAKLVKIWRGEPAASTPPVTPHPELRRQIAPSTSRASAPTPVGERIWSKAEYEAAYDVRNAQRHGEKKAKEMIAEADRAVAEGRVRWF